MTFYYGFRGSEIISLTLIPGNIGYQKFSCTGYLGGPRLHLDPRKDQGQGTALWVAAEAATKRGQWMMVTGTAPCHSC